MCFACSGHLGSHIWTHTGLPIFQKKLYLQWRRYQLWKFNMDTIDRREVLFGLFKFSPLPRFVWMDGDLKVFIFSSSSWSDIELKWLIERGLLWKKPPGRKNLGKGETRIFPQVFFFCSLIECKLGESFDPKKNSVNASLHKNGKYSSHFFC